MSSLSGSQKKKYLGDRPLPNVQFSTTWKELKGEDVLFNKVKDWVGDDTGAGNFWSIFMVCDGHGGVEAASFTCAKLWNMLKPQLPTCDPPEVNDSDGTAWCTSVQKAIVKTFKQIEEDFAEQESDAGCTVTLALICDWTLTIANLGDSDAMLDTLTEVVEASVTHRLDDSEQEKQRFRDAGVELARLESNLASPSSSEDTGIGPVRCWPAGLANGRSIGDKVGGESVLPIPHIRQYLLPYHGARIILASDGLWDILKHRSAVEVTRTSAISVAANRLMTAAIYHNDWAFGDDTSIVVIEVSPVGGDEFYMTAKQVKKLSGFREKLLRAVSCLNFSHEELRQEILKGHVEMLGDVDGLNVDLGPDNEEICVKEHMHQVDSASELEQGRLLKHVSRSLEKISISCNLEKQLYLEGGYDLIHSATSL